MAAGAGSVSASCDGAPTADRAASTSRAASRTSPAAGRRRARAARWRHPAGGRSARAVRAMGRRLHPRSPTRADARRKARLPTRPAHPRRGRPGTSHPRAPHLTGRAAFQTMEGRSPYPTHWLVYVLRGDGETSARKQHRRQLHRWCVATWCLFLRIGSADHMTLHRRRDNPRNGPTALWSSGPG